MGYIGRSEGAGATKPVIADAWHTLVEQLACGVEDPSRFEEAYHQVSLSVRRILSAYFHDRDVAEEAVESAFGTFLRRVKVGEFVLGDATAVEQFLVKVAFAKAHALRRRESALEFEPTDSVSSSDLVVIREEDQAAEHERHQVMKRFLQHLFEQMEPFLENDGHRRIFEHLLATRGSKRTPGQKRPTLSDIAEIVGLSERTVQRVYEKFNKRWCPLADEADREFRALISRVEGVHV